MKKRKFGSREFDNKGQMISFFIGAMLAVILALQVAYPVIDEVLNDEISDTTVSAEEINISAYSDDWLPLANNDITNGTFVLINTTKTFVQYTDYDLNETDGTVSPLSTGTLNFSYSNDTYNVSYRHSLVTSIANMSGAAQSLVDLIPLFLILVLLMVFIRPLM